MSYCSLRTCMLLLLYEKSAKHSNDCCTQLGIMLTGTGLRRTGEACRRRPRIMLCCGREKEAAMRWRSILPPSIRVDCMFGGELSGCQVTTGDSTSCTLTARYLCCSREEMFAFEKRMEGSKRSKTSCCRCRRARKRKSCSRPIVAARAQLPRQDNLHRF